MAEAFIIDAVRTAGGKRKGAFRDVHPVDLGAIVLDQLVERTSIDPSAIDDVIVGCVTQSGEQSFAFGRNLVLASKLPQSVPAVTIDRQCGSSLQALQFAAQAVMSGTQDLVIAAGAESMTRVPMGSNFTLHRQAQLGQGPWPETMLSRYGVGEFSQFAGAHALADKYGLTREDLDSFALESHRKAAAAINAGAFKDEIVPVDTADGVVTSDEGVRFDASASALANLQPLVEGGIITAGNASQMSDGASAALIAGRAAVDRLGLKPIGRVVSLAVTAGDPVIMLEEPIPATRLALSRAGLEVDDIDVFEVNEAFASVPLAWLKAIGADPAKLNVNGGAIALGHPLGATGTKLIATLTHALRRRRARFGLVAICEGGGIANAAVIEAL